jgi:prevent-host-death family protein
LVVRTIPHRELRNNSSAVLRAVAQGETIQITNHGEVVAILVPPGTEPPSTLRIRRARIRGGFAQLGRVELDHPVQESLDELRPDR